MPIGKKEVIRALGGDLFITKGEFKEKMKFSSYNQVRPFFYGLEHVGHRYLTEDVAERFVEMKECD